jgi:predicted RND superfamily exporter protein
MTGPAARLIALSQAAVKAHLECIFRVTCKRPMAAVAVPTLALLLSLFSILTIRFESDIFKLFPTQSGPLRLFLDSLEWTGSAGEAYFLLEGDRERLPAEAEAFAARLKTLEVDGKPAFRKVAYRVFDPAEAAPFAEFVGYAAVRPQLFLAPAETDAYVERLAPASMEGALRRAGTELAAGSGIAMRDLVAADPLYLRELILPRLKKGSQAFDLDPESPYFLSRDGRLMIMVAETARPVQDMAFARKLVAGINQARAGASVSISCAGAHLSAVIDEQVMKQNIIACVVSSLFVVLGLFYLTYRRVLPTLLIPLIIVFGTTLALGTAGLLLPSIHIISFAFTALIIGLGTDYSIHLYDRFHCERSAGKDTPEALRLAVVDTGHGVFTAAATTALPFLALTISDVRALAELGLLVGLGVVFSMYATFFFLPPLLIFTERRFPRQAYRPLPSFGLGFLWRLTGRHPRTVALASALAVAGLLGASFFISFEGELKNLQPRHSEAFITQERIERHLSLSPKQMLVAVEGKSLADVVARGARIGELAEAYRGRGEIAAYSWMGQVVNDPARQEEVLARLRKGLDGTEPGRDLSGALAGSGFDPAMFQGTMAGLAGLRDAGTIRPEEAVEALRRSPLRGMVDRYLVEREGSFHLLSYIHYRGKEFPQGAFLKELATIDPRARATSVDLVSGQLAESVRKSFTEGFIIGGVLVLFLLVVHFESLAGIASALLPVLAGVVSMTGLMALTGMRLNFMNSMVLVTILGMGSDYGLHVFHRVRGAADAPGDFIQAGRAVLLSALTTIAGFGSLAFTDYGAMASIGWATNYGIGATVFFSLVALPGWLALAGTMRRNV